ncbi:MAG: hypothetical protein GXO79_13135 [Chlorobi bacterium]|nr:hypothetical protein [Chlorobiota bacterium]
MFYIKNNRKNVNTNKGLFSFIFLCFYLLYFISCNFQQSEKKQITEDTEKKNYLPYDLMNPDNIYLLPSYLEEISGISCFKENKIACIQDEQAVIYIFDIQKGQVTSKFDFGKNDDYEDIAIVGDNAFVLKSNGTIFKVKNFEKKKKRKTTKIETLLNYKNNTEGLVYDKATNSLLIACKWSPSIIKKKPYEGFKAIYRFGLKDNKLLKKPAYLIDLSETDKIRIKGTVEKKFIDAAKKINIAGDISSFQPSGIAISPINKENIYIISSVGNLLIVMNKLGIIIDIFELDTRIFNQPEGICFSKNGDLFISNENKNGSANILRFRPEINHNIN